LRAISRLSVEGERRSTRAMARMLHHGHAVFGLELLVSGRFLHVRTLRHEVLHFRFEAAV